MNHTKLRVGVIGTGEFVQSCHVPGLQSHPQAEVVALCGSDYSRARAVADRLGIRDIYLDYEEMWRFIVLDDVNGKRLVITMTASPTNPTIPVTEFSKFTDEGQEVLNTVVFSKP